MFKKARTFLLLLLQLTLVSCKTTATKTSETLREANFSPPTSMKLLQQNEVQNRDDIAMKNLVNSLEKFTTAATDVYTNEVAKNVLRQKKDFSRLLKACHTYSPYKVEFSRFYKVSNSKYLVQLLCTMGAYQPEYSYFLYELQNGLDVKPLEMSAFYASGSPVQRTSITGIAKYNPATQELTVEYKCDANYSCGSVATYKFDEDEFVLKEFIYKYRERSGEIKDRKIYP